MKSRIVMRFTAGLLAGKKFSLGPGDFLIIGSDPACDVRLDDVSQIAGRHACIFHSPEGKILFKDLGSKTGTFVDGKRLKRTINIHPGQTVVLGKSEVFHSSWWNALQLSQITQMTRLTAQKMHLSTARRAIAEPQSKSQNLVPVVSLALVATVATIGVLTGRTRLSAVRLADNHTTGTVERSEARTRRDEPRSAKIAEISQDEANPNDHFVWDEIVNISRRFGDAPPSTMDDQFVGQVREWIERMTKGGAHKAVLARKAKYWKEIEAALRTHNLPTELGYVVWVESSFEPQAASSSGALGLWQFVPDTAREYGLHVDEQSDERTNATKASLAAARYFGALLRMFGSERYLLALASYNSGQNRVHRQEIIAAVRHARRADFWHLRNALPKETVDYVPKILAAIIIGRNPDRW